jgi:hypothetical protein
MDNSGSTTVAERLHQQCFVAVNNDHGVSDANTVFRYLVDGSIISGTYAGGSVMEGTLLGQITGPDTIRLLYQCVTVSGDLLAGWSEGTVEAADSGKTQLVFTWGWLFGTTGGGTSCYEACDPDGSF